MPENLPKSQIDEVSEFYQNLHEGILEDFAEMKIEEKPIKEHPLEKVFNDRRKIIESYTNAVSGVYMIENTANGKIYIGSSSDVNGRWELHKFDLNNNIHHNLGLQYDWKMYKGEENFVFSILWQAEDGIDRNEIYFIEQVYLDQHQPDYNVKKKVDYCRKNYNPKESSNFKFIKR